MQKQQNPLKAQKKETGDRDSELIKIKWRKWKLLYLPDCLNWEKIKTPMDLRFIQVFRSTLYLNSSKKFEYPPSSHSPPSFFFFFIISQYPYFWYRSSRTYWSTEETGERDSELIKKNLGHYVILHILGAIVSKLLFFTSILHLYIYIYIYLCKHSWWGDVFWVPYFSLC